MTWFDDSSFWIMHHVFFVHNAPELFERRMVSRCMADGVLENFGTRVYFVSLQFIRGFSTGTLLVSKRGRGWAHAMGICASKR